MCSHGRRRKKCETCNTTDETPMTCEPSAYDADDIDIDLNQSLSTETMESYLVNEIIAGTRVQRLRIVLGRCPDGGRAGSLNWSFTNLCHTSCTRNIDT